MAAIIKIVPDEHFEIIKKYLPLYDDAGVVLMSSKMAEKLKVEDDELITGYDFGGEADIWVDVVLDETHLFVDHIKEERAKNERKI